MSENTQNQKVVVVANQKSPLIGFILALFLGWLGVDRFYMGGTKGIVLGVIKLVCVLIIFMVCIIFRRMLFFAGDEAQIIMSVILFAYIFLYIGDLICVPFEIINANRKKIAIAKGISNTQDKNIGKKITKNIGKIFFVFILAIAVLSATIALNFVLGEYLIPRMYLKF